MKKPIKKNLLEKKAPNYEPDTEYLHNAIRAELAVIKAEEEKEAREEEAKPMYYCRDKSTHEVYKSKSLMDYELYKIKDRYSPGCLKNLKHQYTKYLILSIILSLGLGATLMFLILNNQ